jgi:Fe-S cluster assembly protein SufD
VKCSHGATVGALDADSLFYLRARGIPEPGAAMLVEAFLHEAVETVADETPGALTRALAAWWARQGAAA